MRELMWWRSRSTVRFRITALASLVVVVVLTVTAAALVLVVRNNLLSTLDADLRLQSELVATAWDQGSPPALPYDPDDAFAQVTRGSEVVAASPNITGMGVAVADPAAGGEIRTLAVEAVDGTRMRVLTRIVDPATTPETMLHVGIATDDVDETVATLATALAAGVPALTLALAALVWILVGRTLRPVEAIRGEVASIGGGDLARRVPVPASADEIALLAETMNEMLERLQTSRDTLSRFVADASHELRSPLTRLRTQLEVEGDQLDHTTLLEEVMDMQRLVEDLLFLARLDAGQPPPDVGPLELDDLVHEELARLATDKRVSVRLDPAMVEGSRHRLGRAIRNVLENAARFASRAIDVTVRSTGTSVIVTVEDDGPGLPAGRHDEVFERFARIDDARTRIDGGVGLGLAIARQIVRAHGGTITASDGRDGARFTIELPSRGDPADDPANRAPGDDRVGSSQV